jgi:hypothetical protein
MLECHIARRECEYIKLKLLKNYNCFPCGAAVQSGHGILMLEVSRPHSDTQNSVSLVWTSDQPVAETST